ncbi:hypothetical protein EIN_052540 [Entamoeba invadens IP1]|uniref:hypothetical protein n=1 Tax=Entamoeba invadens IP1 TaxID=370355 RepID=UPI0002C3E20A|nr:hypothetical protein EIN_052540 [Entamoeba invadens IP1]ELP93039.1 hypothetical protein EIN_052540 [Entamoeba invadens IP1]|eukprot:XP_004259810.1 hypothetical protein EIN_052540 [Entamoeba invadens IP1]
MASGSNKTIDMIFLVHGLSNIEINAQEQWINFSTPLEKKLGSDCVIKYVKANSNKTTDGIVVGGLRVANEVCQEMKDEKESRTGCTFRIHLIGHSLGGLYLRQAIPLLVKRGVFNSTCIPFSFLTLETPHLGVKKPDNNGGFDDIFKTVSNSMFSGQTINELQLTDRPYPPYDPKFVDEFPLLFRMVEDEYINALKIFKHLTLIQNIKFSFQVPYVSAALDRAIPYDREFYKDKYFVDGFDFAKDYTDIIDGCEKKYILQPQQGEVIEEKKDGCVIYEKMVEKLNQLPWRRVNVNFRTKSPDVHQFLIGQFLRKKIFKNWGNDDVDNFIKTVAELIERDVEIDNGKLVKPNIEGDTLIDIDAQKLKKNSEQIDTKKEERAYLDQTTTVKQTTEITTLL